MSNKIKEQIIVKMYGGSRLYNLATPQSDTDILGIFLPNKEDLILQKAPEEYNLNNKGCDSCIKSKSKEFCATENNGIHCGMFEKDKKDYIEEKYFSLHRFLELCYNGNPMALEMLGTNQLLLNERMPYYIWDFLVKNRKKFFTKDLKGFLGYVKSQAHLYSRKGDRVNLISEVLSFMKAWVSNTTLDEVACNFRPDTTFPNKPKKRYFLDESYWLKEVQNKYGAENIEYLESYGNSKVPHLKICGKYFPLSITMKEAIARLEKLRDRYGIRAKEASENKADFKAISHAYRVIYEVMSIAKTGDLKFPFDEDIKNKIMDVKLGKVAVEKCYDELEGLVNEAEKLIQKSDLPEAISNETREFFDEGLLSLYE